MGRNESHPPFIFFAHPIAGSQDDPICVITVNPVLNHGFKPWFLGNDLRLYGEGIMEKIWENRKTPSSGRSVYAI